MHRPNVEIRAQLAPYVAHLREQGEGYGEIAELLEAEHGVRRSPVTLRKWVTDPDGRRARASKARYFGHCQTCGARTSSGDGAQRPRTACRKCAVQRRTHWTRETIAEAIQAWAAKHDGRSPTSYQWSAAGGRPANYPSAARVIAVYGSWPAALDNALGSVAGSKLSSRE